MEAEVLKEKENVYLKRKEIELSIKHEGSTPSKAEVVKELAARYSAPEENIVLNYIVTGKGTRTAIARAKIYREKPKIKMPGKKTGTKPAEQPKEPAKAQ